MIFALLLYFPVIGSAAPVDNGPPSTEVKSTAAPAPLFSPVNAQTQADAAIVRDREVVRSRRVVIDLNLLPRSADRQTGGIATASVISLNLFDDVNFVAEADRVERTSRGMAWVGRLRGIDLSQVTIIVNGDVVTGNISMPGGRYHIRFVVKGVHEVQEIDQSLFPQEAEPIEPPRLQEPDDHSSLQKKDTPAYDDGSTIDVMVVYSATTRAAAGGTAAMLAQIDLSVLETNQSYQNSGIAQRLRLVHAEEVAYTETGSVDQALDCITNTADGCIDHIHTLRNTYGADVVSFWIEDDPNYCGVSWVMTTISPSFSSYAFSAVKRSCATGVYAFGHEMGHNMGADHDVYVTSSNLPFPYAHGYTYTATVSPWRTIMAYNDACIAAGTSCPRIPYWSNPSISYGGVAMGNATADNAQTLDNTAFTVANFRAGVPTETLAASVAGSGLWVYDPNTATWAQITPDTPENIIYSGSTLCVDFGAIGIWKWDGTAWTQLSPSNPENMVASGSTLYAEFGAGGIWMWNGFSWTKLTPSNPENMVASGSTFYAEFGAGGIWMWNGFSWTKLTPSNPENMVASGSTLYAEFGAGGIWKWDGTAWTQLSPSNPENMVASGSTLYAEFGAGGIWKWDGTAWTQLSPSNPENMVASGSTFYAEFGAGGIWMWNGYSWRKLTTSNPVIMAISN
jgi:hypothetical protein